MLRIFSSASLCVAQPRASLPTSRYVSYATGVRCRCRFCFFPILQQLITRGRPDLLSVRYRGDLSVGGFFLVLHADRNGWHALSSAVALPTLSRGISIL